MWTAGVITHLNAGLPMRHEWAFHAQVKDLSTNAIVNKGVWTGAIDYGITLDGLARTYEGVLGGLSVAGPRARVGPYVMKQDLSLALSPEGLEIVQLYNTRNAKCDLFCLAFDERNGTYLGYQRFFKGFIDGSALTNAPQGDFDSDMIKLQLVSIAKRGTMSTTGKKSNQSQHDRDASDDFYKYASLGSRSSDNWAYTDDE